MSEDFDVIMKSASETATIKEIEKVLPIRFRSITDKLSSTVKPNELKVDYSYQRQASKKKVDLIAKDFNQSAVGVITLSIRENNDLYIIDGQHRILALKKLGRGDMPVNAIVLFNLSVSEEAELFVTMNDNRTKPKKADIYRAAVQSGDDSANEIESMLSSMGLRIGEKPGIRIVRAVGTLHKVHSKIGIEKLTDTFKVLIEANGDHSSSFQAEYIEAVSCIIVNYENVDLTRLAQGINRLGDPSLAVLKAATISGSNKPFSRIVSLVSLMIDQYNHRLTKNRLDKYNVYALNARNYLDGK